MIVQIEDSEETEEEQPMFKRNRTEPAQEENVPEEAQSISENMDTELIQ
ncbi:hypothetical protein A2U01_0098405, partial [Trifolium medium]|nr:hypothetical protein [Trifolium medium]